VWHEGALWFSSSVRPQRVFALTDYDFTGSPTRWLFPA
jgi:hypothetical protein